MPFPAKKVEDDAMQPRRELLSGIIDRRLSRRRLLKSLALLAATEVCAPGLLRASQTPTWSAPQSFSTGFTEVKRGRDETIHVPKGYEAQVLLRWGDPLFEDSPPFDPMNQSAEAQRRQFGYNCDYVGYLPLPLGSRNSSRGLLGVNHEFSSLKHMQPGFIVAEDAKKIRKEHIDTEFASLGFSVVEIERRDKVWSVVRNSRHNRRIDLGESKIAIGGPARGHDRMKTKEDPKGTVVRGTFSNCAGGMTPWGTFLTCEENFQDYFFGLAKDPREARAQARYEINVADHYYRLGDSRFDSAKEPHEPNRFGWVVEIDPYRPDSTPVKRTALGRFRHEGATCVVNADGRVVVYSGDDNKGEYLYRFVTKGTYDPKNRAANFDLLDEGELSVGVFDEEGGMEWRPMVFGRGPLTPKNGFDSQADIVIEARRAGDLLGATPMDRPEDIETNPTSGLVYVMLTNNDLRGVTHAVHATNPRANNVHGQVLELHPPVTRGRRDHAARHMQWEMFLKAGDPKNEAHGADYQKSAVTDDGWLSCPDNAAFDQRGRLWISTDGAGHTEDGLYACDTLGPGRALTRMFMRSPRGSEVCGPMFTPDDTTLFCAIQHPGAGEKQHFAEPTTRWPDFDDKMPARPSVVAIVKKDGGVVGS